MFLGVFFFSPDFNIFVILGAKVMTMLSFQVLFQCLFFCPWMFASVSLLITSFLVFFPSFHDTDGRRLPQNHRQKVFSNGSLIITEVQRSSDWGRYECLVFNQEGHSVRKDLFVNVMGKTRGNSFSLSLSLKNLDCSCTSSTLATVLVPSCLGYMSCMCLT